MSNIIEHKEERSVTKYSKTEIDLIKKTYCIGASNEELSLFLAVAESKGLSIINNQIYSIPRGGKRTIQVSIDGFRLIAARTGRLISIGDALIKESNDKIISATVTVKMVVSGMVAEFTATAYFDEYCQKYNGKPTGLWEKMPRAMISKCAESLALRKAAPAELSGLYTSEEMDQADIKDVKIVEPKVVKSYTSPVVIESAPVIDAEESLIDIIDSIEERLSSDANLHAKSGMKALTEWFKSLIKEEQEIIKPFMSEPKKVAMQFDKEIK